MHWPAFAQVNTEAMRRGHLEDGWYNHASVGIALNAGNTEFLKGKGSWRTDVVHGDLYSFLVGSYERGVQDNENFINKAFLHLRGVYRVAPILRLELFGQKEFNEFLLLKDRTLLGGGGRLTLIEAGVQNADSGVEFKAYLGIGGMWEREVTDENPDVVTALPRSTNYLNIFVGIDERIAFSLIGYYQPALENFADFRFLSDARLAFSLSDVLAFTATLHYRYDGDPPDELKPYDLELENGISVTF